MIKVFDGKMRRHSWEVIFDPSEASAVASTLSCIAGFDVRLMRAVATALFEDDSLDLSAVSFKIDEALFQVLHYRGCVKYLPFGGDSAFDLKGKVRLVFRSLAPPAMLISKSAVERLFSSYGRFLSETV